MLAFSSNRSKIMYKQKKCGKKGKMIAPVPSLNNTGSTIIHTLCEYDTTPSDAKQPPLSRKEGGE